MRPGRARPGYGVVGKGVSVKVKRFNEAGARAPRIPPPPPADRT